MRDVDDGVEEVGFAVLAAEILQDRIKVSRSAYLMYVETLQGWRIVGLGSRIWKLEGCSARVSSVEHVGQEERRKEGDGADFAKRDVPAK